MAAHQANIYNALFKRADWIEAMITRNLGYALFSDPYTMRSVYGAYVLSYLACRMKNWDDQILERLCLAESYLPLIPDTEFRPQRDARSSMQRRIVFLLKNMREINYFVTFPPEDDTDDKKIARLKGGSHGTVAFTHLPIEDAEATILMGLNPDRLVPILESVIELMGDQFETIILQHIVTSHIALIKQGNASTEFISRVTSEVSAIAQKEINVDTDVMADVYREFMMDLTPDQVRNTANTWKSLVPANYLRVQTVLTRGAGHNLICFLTIKKALLQVPTLKWREIIQIIGVNE